MYTWMDTRYTVSLACALYLNAVVFFWHRQLLTLTNTSLEICYIRQCFKEDFEVLLYFCSQDRDTPNHVKSSHFLQFSFYSVGVFQSKRHAHYPGSLCQTELTVSYVLPREEVQLVSDSKEAALPFSPPFLHWACTCWVSTEDCSGRSEETFAC